MHKQREKEEKKEERRKQTFFFGLLVVVVVVVVRGDDVGAGARGVRVGVSTGAAGVGVSLKKKEGQLPGGRRGKVPKLSTKERRERKKTST